MKIEIEVTEEQLKSVMYEGQLLTFLAENLKLKFPSAWQHIYDQGYSQAEQEASDYYDQGCGCGCC